MAVFKGKLTIKNKGHIRYAFCLVLVAFVLISYITRLVDWQLINSTEYRERANRNNLSITKTEALRGEIVDVNGVSFAENETGYAIVFERFTMPEDRENEIILELIDLMEKKGEPWIDELPIVINKKGEYEFVPEKEKEIKALKGKDRLNVNEYTTAEDCMKKLVERYKCENYDRNTQRKLVSAKYNMESNGYYRGMNGCSTFAEGISPDLVSIVSEKFQENSGIRISLTSKRHLVNPDIAPHIIGTIGKMSQEQYDSLQDKGYTIEDVIGKTGIEYKFEQELRGEGGERKIEISRDGKVLNVLKTKNANPGHTIFLTIDSRIQRVAMESLARNVKNSGKHDCVAGGVVALNVKDFSIIAAATCPTYDASKLGEPGYYSGLLNDKKNPLFNRAFDGSFAPGSIFKPLVACGALQEGVLTPTDKVRCSGIYYYPGLSNFTTKCLGVHGMADLKYAMAKSCNCFFSEAGRRLGINNMNLYSKRFGLGVKTGIELNETAGVLAGPEHSAEIGSVWSNPVTIKSAIGQSDNLFSPLQLATYMATIANGGKRYRPHLIRKVTDYKRENVIWENDPENPELVETSGVSEENLNIVKECMRQVVLSGTATNFSSYPVSVFAKTGTAQNNGSDHTTFICAAPYENPEIAIAVVVEHGSSGMISKNVAKDIMDAYFFGENQEE